MAIIEKSKKLSSEQEEYRICSKPYIFYRVIVDQNGVRLMTATASEDTGEYRAYKDLKSLISATSQVFDDFGMEIIPKEDHAGRPYIETTVYPDKEHLLHIATTALDRIGFEDVSVIALREMKTLYDEFSISDNGEDTYLSDGMWVTPDGRMIEK